MAVRGSPKSSVQFGIAFYAVKVYIYGENWSIVGVSRIRRDMRNRLLRRQTFIITVMAFVVFIVFAICIKDAMLGTAHGADSDECDQTVQIDDTVYACLYASGFDMEEEYYISEQFPVQNSIANAEKIYFVFCKDKCIGELLVSGSCEENIAFFQERCNEITDAYLHDVSLVIVRLDQDHIYCQR